MPAREFFLSLGDSDKAKVLRLFQWHADSGPIRNPTKFRPLGGSAGKKYSRMREFKSFQVRFIGDFRPGGRFLLAHGLIKKQDDLPVSDVERAARILTENDEWERGHEKG
jgi:hypothetical protein